MAASFYRAVRDAARREVPLLAAGNTTLLQAATRAAYHLAVDRSHASRRPLLLRQGRGC
ncbi:hypothetical protein [Streptomyces sp. NPDC055681]